MLHREDPPDPTAFDWWSGIVLPSFTGLLSLLLAGISLWIALRALKTAAEANAIARDVHRAERQDQRKATALRLNSTWQRAGQAWINAKKSEMSEVIPEILREQNDARITGDVGAWSLAGQVLMWHSQVFSGPPGDEGRQRRVDFMVAVSQEWSAAMSNYVDDDSETWTMERSALRP